MNASQSAYVYAGITIMLWSTVATAFKLALRGLDPVQLLLTAAIASSAILLVILAVQGRLRDLLQLTRKQWLFSAGLGLLNPFCYYMLLFQAYAVLPAQIAQSVNSTWAITTALLSVPFLGQKLRPRDGLCLLLGYGGVVIVASGGRWESLLSGNVQGLALAFGSTFILASYWIANTRSSLPPVVGLCASFLCSLPWVTGATLLLSTWPYSPSFMSSHALSLAAAVHVGLFEMGLGYWMWIKAMKLAPSAARLSVCAFCVPFLSLFWISLILHEPIATATYAGLICIVAGGILQNRS